MPEFPADLRSRIRALEGEVSRLADALEALESAGRHPLGGQMPVIAFGFTQGDLYPGGSTTVRFYTEDDDGALVDRTIIETAYAANYAESGTYLPQGSNVVLLRLIRRWWIIGGACWVELS